MHNSDFDAHTLLCDTATDREFLPRNRQIASGRTHSTIWSPSGYGSAFVHQKPRRNVWDVLGWIASGALLLATAWLVWG